MKELQLELAETRQKLTNLAKQNTDQLTSQVLYLVAYKRCNSRVSDL